MCDLRRSGRGRQLVPKPAPTSRGRLDDGSARRVCRIGECVTGLRCSGQLAVDLREQFRAGASPARGLGRLRGRHQFEEPIRSTDDVLNVLRTENLGCQPLTSLGDAVDGGFLPKQLARPCLDEFGERRDCPVAAKPVSHVCREADLEPARIERGLQQYDLEHCLRKFLRVSVDGICWCNVEVLPVRSIVLDRDVRSPLTSSPLRLALFYLDPESFRDLVDTAFVRSPVDSRDLVKRDHLFRHCWKSPQRGRVAILACAFGLCR